MAGLGILMFVATAPVACKRKAEAEARYQTVAIAGMKTMLMTHLAEWEKSALDLQAAAPTPKGRGWDVTQDVGAIAAMKAAWHRGRRAYEQIEGAVSPIFPESDLATDSRYDDFLAVLGPDGDPNAFDDVGVIGMHGIERILWSDQIPAEVIQFERNLIGPRPAAMPADETQALAFKTKLVGRLVADIRKLQSELAPLDLDLGFALRGLIDLAAEQVEKVDKVATGEEESRYAQATMTDLRSNLDGCVAAYELFRPWITSKTGGSAADGKVMTALDRLRTAYKKVPGAAIPRPGERWSGLNPPAGELAKPFGQLFTTVRHEADEAAAGGLVYELHKIAVLLGLAVE